jgi:hypothetical protein
MANSFIARIARFGKFTFVASLSVAMLMQCCGQPALGQTENDEFGEIGRGSLIRAASQTVGSSEVDLVNYQDRSSGVRSSISDQYMLVNQDQSTENQSVQGGANQDDVPNPPITGDENRQIGPPLSVQSNAATMPDDYYRGDRCNLSCPFELFGTSDSGRRVGGWAQYGYHNRNTRGFNRHAGDDAFHQFWMFAEREACRDCNWNFGYRVDAVYGLDAQRTQALGNNPVGNPQDWDNSWDNGRYGYALPQAYIQITKNNLNLKAGKFFSIFGYEAVPSVENFFYSRSNSMFFIEPFTHTGVLSEYQYDCNTTLFGGATMGWDTGFDQVGDAVNYIGGFQRRLNESVDFTYLSSRGDTGYRGSGYMHSMVLDVMLTDKINTVIQSDWSDLGNNQDLSLLHYLFYRQSDCLAWGSRMEWLHTDRFDGVTRSSWSATFGANVRPHANLTFRPELRIDSGQAALSRGDIIFGVDAILTF